MFPYPLAELRWGQTRSLPPPSCFAAMLTWSLNVAAYVLLIPTSLVVLCLLATTHADEWVAVCKYANLRTLSILLWHGFLVIHCRVYIDGTWKKQRLCTEFQLSVLPSPTARAGSILVAPPCRCLAHHRCHVTTVAPKPYSTAAGEWIP